MRLWIVTALFLLTAGCAGSSGNEGPNGGDSVAQKAGALMEDVYSAVSAAPRTFPEIQPAALRSAIDRTRLFVREHTFAHGTETDAVNNGSDTIELNISRWGALDGDQRMALLLHELLGLMGLEKDSYRISNRLLSVKNRYLSDQDFDCTSPGQRCQLTLRFERSERGFMAKAITCNDFPSYPFTIFRRLDSNTYSTNGECPEDGGPCLRHSGDGRHWDTVSFLDGQQIYFSGVQRQTLLCDPVTVP